VAAAAVFFLAVLMVAVGTGGPKIYWHFTFKAFVHLPDQSAVEWAWVTMVEHDTPKAFPAEAETARQQGGTLQGTVFAFVRGAAWRSAHRYQLDDRCHDRPATKTISWEESESDSVFCGGQFFEPRPYRDETGRVTLGPQKFRLVFTARKILHEDGRWEDLKRQAQLFVGAISVAGRPAEETKGRFHLQEVNYRDNLKHYKVCDKAWVEAYLTAFRHYNNQPLEDIIPDVGQSNWGADNYGPDHKNQILYNVSRSTSREHPHWKLRFEWARPVIEREGR
jgi:hypothetical protein